MERKEKIAVVGVGLMGHGIAQVFAQAGHEVCIQDPDDETLSLVQEHVGANLQTLGLKPGAVERITPESRLEDAVAEAAFVFEAAPERLELKQGIFESLGTLVGENTILASNSSVMSIGEIGRDCKGPGRVVGTHWWNLPYLGGLIPTATALIAEYSPLRTRNFAYALALTGIPLGGMLSAFLGILLIGPFGWRVMFVAGALPALVFVPLALKYLPESVAFLAARGRTAEAEAVARRFRIPPETEVVRTAQAAEEEGAVAPGRFGSLRSLFSGGYVRATFVFWTVSFFIIYGLIAWLPQIMIEAGYELESALGFLLAYNLGAIFGSVLISVAADRIGSKPTIVFTFLLTACSITLLSFQWPTLALLAFAASSGAGVVTTQTMILGYISKLYPSRMRATALGWAMGIGRIGSVVAPPFFGILIGSGLGVAWNFYAIAIPGLLGALVIFLVPRFTGFRSPAPAPEEKVPAGG